MLEEILEQQSVDMTLEKTDSAISLSEQYIGPLPHPRILLGYEDVLPGAADRILKMAEAEANHRHLIDKRCVGIDSRDSLLGIVFALILGLISILGGIYVIKSVPETSGVISGTVITGTGLAAIVGTFITGTKATWKVKYKAKDS